MIDEIKSVFIVGIKGVGMANLAVILKKMGKNVTGSDTDEEQITDETLREHGISWTVGFEPSSLPIPTDPVGMTVVWSAAHGGVQNPIVKKARELGIRTYHQAQFLGLLIEGFEIKIAVAGSHGKTTTAALLAYTLIKLGQKPTYIVGTSSFSGYPAGDLGDSNYFVIEADEYAVDPPSDKTIKFHFLAPDYILCTNVDFDHPDVYADLTHVRREFEAFFKKAKKRVIMCPENEPGYVGTKFESNKAGVKNLLLELGFEDDKINKAMAGFAGAKRRFEKIAYINDTYLLDDYAHHPAEISQTIKAARARFASRRIIVLFQSHTYSRTQALLSEFGKSLSLADLCIIAPIFPSARENPEEFHISAQNIAEAAKSTGVIAVDALSQVVEELKEIIKKGDVVFTMGAGDIYKLKNDIIEVIKKL